MDNEIYPTILHFVTTKEQFVVSYLALSIQIRLTNTNKSVYRERGIHRVALDAQQWWLDCNESRIYSRYYNARIITVGFGYIFME